MKAMVAVLGAGAGSRMAGGKLDRDLGGRPLGMWALSTARSLGAPVIFIAPPDVPVWLGAGTPECNVIANPRAGSGMASSLVLAAQMAMQRRAAALLVLLADMPFVRADTLRDLLALGAPDEVRACRYADGRLGPPACFGAQRLGVLSNLTGDAGARHILNQPGFAQGVEASATELLDIDTQEDLERARAFAERRDDPMR